jgi:hypothetical protein
MDLTKVDELHELLNEFADVRAKLKRLGNILDTDRGDKSKRNIGGFLVSPTLYYSIYEQIKAEYVEFYEELKSKLE